MVSLRFGMFWIGFRNGFDGMLGFLRSVLRMVLLRFCDVLVRVQGWFCQDFAMFLART